MQDKPRELIGRTLSGYQLSALLHHGEASAVYRATQLSVARQVALRFLAPELVRDREVLLAFVQGARAAAQLNHPNIVPIHDVCQVEEHIFFSMEYLPGGSLAAYLRRAGRVPPRLALRMMRDATRALVYAEQKGLSHGSLSPDALFLTRDQRVKVAELGMGTVGKPLHTRDKSKILNRLPYFAPEQFDGRSNSAVGVATDMHSLGCIFFHTLTGVCAHAGSSPEEILQRKSESNPATLTAGKNLHPALVEPLARMLDPDPNRRPDNLAELEAVLDKTLTGSQPVQVEPAAKRGEGFLAKVLGTTRGKVGAGAVLLVLAVITVFVFLANGKPPDAAQGEGGLAVAVGGAEGGEPPDGNTPGGNTAEGATLSGPPNGETAQPGSADESTPVTVPIEQDPAASPAPDDQSCLEDLVTIRDNFRAELLTAAEAEQETRGLLLRCPSQAVTDSAEPYLREYAGVAAEGKARLVQEFVEQQISPRLDQGEFREALALLDDFEKTVTDATLLLGQERSQVLEAAKVAQRSALENAKDLESKGQFQLAIRLLEALAPHLPEAEEPSITTTVRRIERSQTTFQAVEQDLDQTRRQVLRHLLKADFRAAAAAVDSLEPPEHPLLLARRDDLYEEVRLLKSTWQDLVSAVRALQNKDVEIAFNPPASERTTPRVPRTLTVGDVDLTNGLLLVTLKGQGAPGSPVNVLSWDDLSLLSILDIDLTLRDKATASRLRGLGEVLLYFANLPRAKAFMETYVSSGAQAPATLASRMESIAEIRLEQRWEELRPRVDQLGQAGASPDATDLAALQKELEGLIKEYRSTPRYKRVRRAVATAFLEVRKARLRQGGVSGLTHAAKARLVTSKLSLTYDFAPDEAQERDFVQVSKDGRLETAGGNGLILRGEYRLLRGQPFRKVLRVRADVASFDKDAPNVNFAIWTGETDSVTYRRFSPNSVERSPTGDAATSSGSPGYLAFSVGYNPKMSFAPRLRPMDTARSIVVPAFAILYGASGRPLHTGSPIECIWAETILDPLPPELVVRIQSSPTAFEWTVNSLTPHASSLRRRPHVFEELLLQNSEGSVTVFTNGSTLEIKRMQVEGELHPAWLEGEIARRAEEDIKAIEPKYPF